MDPAPDQGALRRTRSQDRDVATLPRPGRHDRGAACAGDAALRGQARHHGRAGYRPDPRLRELPARRHRRRRAVRGAAAQGRRAGARARHADRVRGPGLVDPRLGLPPRVEDRADGRPPGAGYLSGHFPCALASARPVGHPRHPGREDLLRPALGRARDGDGHPPMEPALPGVARSGFVGCRRLPGELPRGRVHRPAVAGDLQYGLPPCRCRTQRA